MKTAAKLPGGGALTSVEDLIPRRTSAEGRFQVGKNGVKKILATGDGKADFILFEEYTLAWVKSELGYPALYPVLPVDVQRPIRAVLMDLDGTSVRSEEFWVWVIERATARLLGNEKFRLQPADRPYVSGHSVSEHLQYCIKKYCPREKVEKARGYYFEITKREMRAIVEGRGRPGAFQPAPGLKEFLVALKQRGIRIGLVTSGLHEKAWPEIVSAFQTLEMGDPKKFYDAIITAGFPLRMGEVGTLGELSPKPHPWLYAEVCRVGLGIPFNDRHHVIGIEDSGAGVVSIRLAGFATLGIAGGNIISSGTRALLDAYCENFAEILAFIDGKKARRQGAG